MENTKDIEKAIEAASQALEVLGKYMVLSEWDKEDCLVVLEVMTSGTKEFYGEVRVSYRGTSADWLACEILDKALNVGYCH